MEEKEFMRRVVNNLKLSMHNGSQSCNRNIPGLPFTLFVRTVGY